MSSFSCVNNTVAAELFYYSIEKCAECLFTVDVYHRCHVLDHMSLWINLHYLQCVFKWYGISMYTCFALCMTVPNGCTRDVFSAVPLPKV